MKTLHLTLEKKWFDLVVSGKKKYEFREIKPYWTTRLVKNNRIHFDEIHFVHGYGKHRPFVRVEFLFGRRINGGNKYTCLCGEQFFIPQYELALGDIVEVGNLIDSQPK
jgi:hypothetical protein